MRVRVSFCSLNHLLFVICITKIAIYQILWENIKTINVRSKVVNFPKLKGKGMCEGWDWHITEVCKNILTSIEGLRLTIANVPCFITKHSETLYL